MLEKLMNFARLAAKLALIEMFVPGGTLLVLVLGRARRQHSLATLGELWRGGLGKNWRIVPSKLLAAVRPRSMA